MIISTERELLADSRVDPEATSSTVSPQATQRSGKVDLQSVHHTLFLLLFSLHAPPLLQYAVPPIGKAYCS